MISVAVDTALVMSSLADSTIVSKVLESLISFPFIFNVNLIKNL